MCSDTKTDNNAPSYVFARFKDYVLTVYNDFGCVRLRQQNY